MYAALTFYKRHWTLEILAALDERPRRFSELQRTVGFPHSTPFNAALQRLERRGLIHHPDQFDHRHYTLTTKGKGCGSLAGHHIAWSGVSVVMADM